jgi:alpha-ketoglutarate-dependent taurine dioxygenase
VSSTSTVAWTPITEDLGAEVDLDLTSPISDAVKAELITLFDERQVLVFKEADIDLDQQLALTTTFSPLVDDPPAEDVVAPQTGRYVTNLDRNYAEGGELHFHTEYAYLDPPIYGLSLWGDEVPEGGPATLFTSNRNAYDSLPAELKQRIAGISAVHVRSRNYLDQIGRYEKIPEDAFQVTYPLIYTHPRTGEKVLFLSQLWTHSIVGCAEDEGNALLDQLFAQLYSPERVYRHVWERHDLVVWDNISAQHAREAVKVGGQPRKLRRVTIGDPTKYA